MFVSRVILGTFSFDVTLVSRALLGFSFTGLLRLYPRAFRILFRWIVLLVSRALSGFSFTGLLRFYLTHI